MTKAPSVTKKDVEAALKSVSASVSSAELVNYSEFEASFGTRRQGEASQAFPSSVAAKSVSDTLNVFRELTGGEGCFTPELQFKLSGVDGAMLKEFGDSEEIWCGKMGLPLGLVRKYFKWLAEQRLKGKEEKEEGKEQKLSNKEKKT